MGDVNPDINSVASTQESISVVPESPPQNTQDLEEQIEDFGDSDSQEQGPNAITSSSGDNVPQQSGGASTMRKNNDCVIDIECDLSDEDKNTTKKLEDDEKEFAIEECLSSEDEFPEGDTQLLLSVAQKVEAETRNGDGAEEGTSVGSTKTPVLDDVLVLPETSEAEAPKKSVDEIKMDPRIKAEDDARRKKVDEFRKFKPMDKIYPDVRVSEHNTVAFSLKPNYSPNTDEPLKPYPPTCTPKWDPKFIPMPFCPENVAIIRTNHPDPNPTAADHERKEPTLQKVSLWSRIVDTLQNIPIMCAQDFVATLKRYIKIPDKLNALTYCLEEIMTREERIDFFDKVIPCMKSLVIQTPEIVTCPLPILRRNVNHNISLSQKQVACLLANAFFCTFPKRLTSEADMPSINFKELFIEPDERVKPVKAQKICFIINYFTRVSQEMPNGVITYSRKNLRHSLMPEWEKLDKGLTNFIPLIQGTIEDDGAGLLKVDFANCFIGGGALGRGAVQEEILFMIYPELILSRLFCEKLNSNEAVIITGCERFSNYKGYSYGFTYDGDYCDTTSFDCKGRRCTQIVAIDALYISRPSFQYHPKHFRREINKAYVGFSSPAPHLVGIATGKWGCGAFNGDPQLKAIIQIIAASHAGRDLAFFTFGDVKCMEDVASIYNAISKMKIKDVWNLLCQYHSICCSTSTPSRSLKEFCQQYAAGQLWQLQQEQQKKATAVAASSSSNKMKEVPLTHFYPSASEKRQSIPVPLDDESVAQLINGIDKINSPAKKDEKTLTVGKRQREDELTEDEIKQQLLSDQDDKVFTEQSEFKQGKEPTTRRVGNGSTNEEGPAASPTSSKRPKRLELQDFYKDPDNAAE